MLNTYEILKKNMIEVYIEGMSEGSSVSLPMLASMGKCTKSYAIKIAREYVERGELSHSQGVRLWRGQLLTTTIYVKNGARK